MRKRYNLIFILVLGLVLLFSLVACNNTPTDPSRLPGEIGGGNDNTDNLPSNASAGLKFSFPVEMSSIFNSIYVDNFKLSEYVEYSVVYYDEAGAVIREVACGGVTDDMIAEEDKPYLSVAGHHNIHVTALLDNGTTVSGVFELHLKDRSGAVSLAKYTFSLKDTNGNDYAYPYFGTLNAQRTEVSVNIERGVTFNSWQEFTRAFQMSIPGKALQRVTAVNANITYSATNGFPFTVGSDETFLVAFTDDVVRVTYDLNVPSDAVLRDPDNDPKKLFEIGGKYSDRTAQRGVGYAVQPENDEINLYHGYTFAGWFNTANDTLWRFSNTVGNQDLRLQARWVLTEYSFTVYTMGGVFVENLTDSTNASGVIINEDNAEVLGYQVIDSTSRFSLSTGELNRITFTGFHFDVDYDKYVARVTVNKDGYTVMLKFSEIYNPTGSRKLLTKGGESLKISDLYSDYQCTEIVDRTYHKVNDDQPVTYVKWIFAEATNSPLYLEKMSYYYTNVVFKDGYTVLADGSVRLDQIKDWTVNELIVPAEITIGGETRKVTEIGERAIANAKAITKLDLSEAVNLTTIGTEAFAHANYLAEIVMPKNNSIRNIGDNAFWDTAFEDKYTEINKGAEFIVIGSMIYKYVGEDKTVIDMSNPSKYYSSETHENMSPEQIERFNNELMGVTSIEDGAFARCPSLQTLKLPSTVTTIRNRALSGLERFTELVISEVKNATAEADETEEGGDTAPDYGSAKHSLLLDIGETAFDGTPFLSESGNLYVPELGAIIIGNVYYRFLNKNATVANVPDINKGYVITHIAPEAFVGCSALSDVKFAKESLIESIGKNALTDTKILRDNKQKGNLYTVYNGILTDFFGNTMDANQVNQIIPSNVNTIAMNAFGQYGRYFETIQIGTQVSRIENYAFSGANMLSKVILTGAEVSGNTIINVPSIGEYAFADANGEMRSGMTLYFNNKVIQLLNKLETERTTPSDKVTSEWLNLYKMHKNHFEAEAIASVVIDREKIANVLLQTSEGNPVAGAKYTIPFSDTYGETPVKDALIITSNTNVERREDLSINGNSIELILLQDPSTVTDPYANKDSNGKYDYSGLWKNEWRNDGFTRYVLYYTYTSAPDKCMVNPNDEYQKNNIFIVTVHNAINENPSFTTVDDTYKDTTYISDGVDKSANDYINKDLNNPNDTRKFWFTGIDGEIEGTSVPTYFTSYPAFKNNYNSVVFHYIDVNGVERTLAPSSISGLYTDVDGNEFTAYIEVNFYGVGTFRFKYSYSVRVSRFKSIEQTKAINIPVNAVASDYLRNTPLNLVGEDGNKTPVNIVSNVFGIIPSFNTSELGMHTVTIHYTRNDADGELTFNVHYTVVLETDETMFTYEPFNENPSNAVNYARITGLKDSVFKNSITTLVLPSVWTDPNTNKVYEISQIGFMQGDANGIFEGCNNLTAVYLPETIQCIGVNTFNGCSNLKYIYTAIQAEATRVSISVNNFVEFGSAYTESIFDDNNVPVEWTVQPVKLTSLAGVNMRANKELIIAGNYVISETEHLMYRLVAIEDKVKVDVDRADIDVYLPDTIYHTVNLVDSQELPITPYYYASGSSFMIKTANYVPDKLVTVGKGAFKGCVDLESLDLSRATKLNDIGVLAFAHTGLKSIDLSNNTELTEIHNQTFDNCIALETVKLPSGITSIGIMAFNQCKLLKSIDGDLSELIYLGEKAFGQALSLTRIDLYEKLTSVSDNEDENAFVGKGVFANCPALTIYCHFDKSKVQSANWDVLWNSFDCPVVWNSDTNDKVEVVVTIDGKDIVQKYFYYVAENGLRYALTLDFKGDFTAELVGQAYSVSGDIVIPNEIVYNGNAYKVTTIKQNAFKDNDRITSVTVTSSLKFIEASAFENCTGLMLFTYSDSNGLEKVASTAFVNTALTDVPHVKGV